MLDLYTTGLSTRLTIFSCATFKTLMQNTQMDLESYLKQNHVWHNFVQKPETIHTKDAAMHANIDIERVTKSLVFLADGHPVIVILPGNRKVSMDKLRRLLMTRDVSLVPFDRAKEYSGYDPGATPPVNHAKIEKTIFEKTLLEFKTIYGGGGVRSLLVELKPLDVVRLTDATIADVVE